MTDKLRYETCARCGNVYNVSATLDLTGRVYVCPRCAGTYKQVMKKIKPKGGKMK